MAISGLSCWAVPAMRLLFVILGDRVVSIKKDFDREMKDSKKGKAEVSVEEEPLALPETEWEKLGGGVHTNVVSHDNYYQHLIIC